MPSADLPLRFPEHLAIVNSWRWSGQHYAKTCNAWLDNMDRNEADILPVLARCYGDENAALWRQRWRIFFMACAELWGFRDGREWLVSHYRLKKKR